MQGLMVQYNKCTVFLLLVSDDESSLCEECCCQFIHPNLLLLCSISQTLVFFPFLLVSVPTHPMYEDMMVLSYFNTLLSLKLNMPTIDHSSSPVTIPLCNHISCLIFIHHSAIPNLFLISLTRKLVLYWALFSSWYSLPSFLKFCHLFFQRTSTSFFLFHSRTSHPVLATGLQPGNLRKL